MKRLKFHRAVVAIAMILIGWLPSLAHDFEVDGIFYNKTSDNTAAVTYKGDSYSSYSNEYAGVVVIPSSVNYNGTTYSVTSIGNEAFADCTRLTSIQIPNSVTSIGDYAFEDCTSLTSIQIPNSVTSIGDYAFYYCKSLTSIEIPNSVTSIGDYAFGCSSLKSIEIPNSVTSIGDYAFKGCSSLTSIEIPNSVTSIGGYAFSGCYRLTSIEIPNSVTSIGYHAFEDCTSLTSIEIPNSVTRIGEYAFNWCDSLTEIKCWATTPPTIYYNTFSNYSADLYVPAGCKSAYESAYHWYKFSNIIELETKLEEGMAFEYGDLTYKVTVKGKELAVIASESGKYSGAVVIPSSVNYRGTTYSVTSIGNEAFADCTSLTSIKIPNSVTSIGNKAFYRCESLTSIEIPNSVTSIGERAFRKCSRLTSIQIPNSVTSIGDNAFSGCESLTSVVIPNSVTSIGYAAFADCTSLTSIEIPNSVTSIGSGAFNNCYRLTSIEIPNSVTSIEDRAFYYCKSLTSIQIGNSVTSIGDEAFKYCSGLISIEIPNSVTSIGEGAFYYCSSLTSVEIPNSVTSIGECAFCNGEKLTIVVLGNSLTSIEKDAFKGCDNIKKIESKATKAPTIENEDQFSENVYANADLFVPIGYEDNYKYAYAWSEFHNIKGKDFSVKATSISLDKNEVSLKPTQTVVLTETIQPYDTSNKKVTWSSSDDNIAKVDTNGLVIAIAVGEATITATTTDGSNLSATCKVTVVPTLAETITLDKTEISIEATETATLVASVLPELTTNKFVTWTSSNEAVATVDVNGVVTAIALGEATITATTTDGTNLSATCKVTVVPTLVVSIEVTPNSVEAEENSEVQLSVNVLPENATYKSVEWSSSNDAIASVNANGLVKIRKEGNVVITATTTDGSNLSATCSINVYSGINGVNGDEVIVATIGDNIVVKNAKLGSNVIVYAADGRIISSEVATDSDVVAEAPAKGIYVVVVDDKSFKVMVK